jgi:membrane protein YdfJ
MANFLYKLGKWAFRRRKTVITGTAAALILALVIGGVMGSAFSAEMSIPGTKSEKAMQVLSEAFQTGGDHGTIQVIYKAPEQETLDSGSIRQLIQQVQEEIRKDEAVVSVTSLFDAHTLSPDKRIGYSTVTYKTAAEQVTPESVDHVKASIEAAREQGLQTELGGTVTLTEIGVGGLSEGVGVIIAFVILMITFGSFLAAGIPILTAVTGLGIGIMLILIGSHYWNIPTFSLSLASMLGLAVGIDYGLFIISRYRQNLRDGQSPEEAMGLANATAGSAVVFAGVTVMIALIGFTFTGIPFLGAMGLSAAVTVLIAVLLSVISLPALLGFTGKLFQPKKLQAVSTLQAKRNKESNAWGRFVTKYPLPVLVACILLLGFVSLPAAHMHLGLPDNGTKSADTTERRGYDLLSEGFGPGMNGPLVIVARAEATDNAAAAIADATKNLSKLPNVAAVTPPQMNPAGDTALLTVMPGTGPQDVKTADLVKLIRLQAEANQPDTKVELMVTGATAVNIDISDMLNSALPKFALFIVGLAFVLLTMVFRSVLIPVKAVLGYLLTLTSTLGFVVFVVQDGHMAGFFGISDPAPVLNFLPVLVAGILFGLAMDYEVFLVSGMREKYAQGGSPRGAIWHGMKTSGSIVLAAGLIMISVFASFIFDEDTIVKSMGLALAFGVLFDALIVRLTLVPAVMALLGKSAWYMPQWLNRILPRIDVEGESFHRATPAEQTGSIGIPAIKSQNG